jgi:pre-mRNA-processing factor 6
MLPGSITLWKQLILLEGEREAKKLLYHAVECVPQCLDMWIELAKLETYENAKLILNKARQNLPLEHSIWIHAAMLEESEGKGSSGVELVLKRAVAILIKNG